MRTLKIKRDSNLDDIEKAFSVLYENPNVELQIPNTLKERGVFGLEGMVSLLIASWLRNGGPASKRVLHTYAKGVNSEDFADLGSSFYGMSALKLSDDILSAKREVVAPEVALSGAYDSVRRIIAKDFSGAFKGSYVAIPSIKTVGETNREFNSPFYIGKKVLGMKGFREVVDSALLKVVPQKGRKANIEPVIGTLSEIIRELFDNAHKHGRENERGDILATNYRGVIFNSVDISEDRLNKIIRGGTTGMIGFTSEWTKWMKDNKRTKLPVLDITVLDSGPGYARRWTGLGAEELTLEDEISSVIQCFEKNRTSGRNKAEGSGLTNVLTDLSQLRGWFRLRTGSVSVSRSFFDGGNSRPIAEKDIKSEKTFIEGVSFNLVIPLVNSSTQE